MGQEKLLYYWALYNDKSAAAEDAGDYYSSWTYEEYADYFLGQLMLRGMGDPRGPEPLDPDRGFYKGADRIEPNDGLRYPYDPSPDNPYVYHP